MSTIMNGSLLRVDSAATTLPGSPTNSFIADEVASTCPLLTPSPPTNALVNPLPEELTTEPPSFVIGDELVNKLQHVTDENEVGDSTSSASSAEPACTQLLHTRNHYHHFNKDTETCQQDNGVKLQNLQLTFRKDPTNYCFMSWNWPMIRKITEWSFLSALIACVGLVVMMIANLPKTCNPPTQWYQGTIMYEIFPASFQDSNNDGIGDLKGLTSRITYLQALGVQSVRLNSIFPAIHYPEDYKNVTALDKIARVLGTSKDFAHLVGALHSRNMTLLLDLPVWPLVKQFHYTINEKIFTDKEHNTSEVHSTNDLLKRTAFPRDNDSVTEAIKYWITQGVDGFYVKGLEHLTDDPNFVVAIRRWKKIIGHDRALIVHQYVIDSTPDSILNVVLSTVDLVDIQLNIEGGVNALKHQIESIKNGTLFAQEGAPWIHWSLGDVDTPRLTTRLALSNATLGATLIQLMLPGTPSIFYGDEIGLQQLYDPDDERADIKHLHQLAAMAWAPNEKQFSSRGVLAWMHGHPTHCSFGQRELIRKMVDLRNESPAIYINSLAKDGCNKANAEVKYADKGLLVLQRFYPRRPSFVIVSNMDVGRINADLSKILYSGEVIVGPAANSRSESISFKSISLWPGESVVIKLD